MDDQDPDVAELIARFAGEGITLEDGGEYQWEEFGVGYDPYDDDDVIPDMLNYHLGKTDDPFAKDDVKYRFDVYSFAMGSMDGKQLQFYDGISFPTDLSPSSISFNKPRMRFEFKVEPTSNGRAAYPRSVKPLWAEFELTDIQSRGIGCVRDVTTTPLAIQGGRTITTRRVVLTVSLRRPPRFRVPILNQAGKEFPYGTFGTGARQMTFRQGTARDFVDGNNVRYGEVGAGPASVWAEQETFKVGQYLAYRFELYLTDSRYRLLEQLLHKLRLYSASDIGGPHLLVSGANGTQGMQGLDVLTHRSEAAQRRHLKSLPMPRVPNVGWQPMQGMTFGVSWLIEGLISHGIILPFEATALVRALEENCPTQVSGSRRGYEQRTWVGLQERILVAMYNEERIKDVEAYVRKKGKFIRRSKRLAEPVHTIRIRRVTVTPTRILLFPPERETSNSVVRQFKDPDSFIRICFADEDNRIKVDNVARTFDKANPTAGVLARVRRVLRHGLTLAGRHFHFLASSASQLREHGCWFVADSFDVNEIYNWMGVINETNVAKYASRMGIPFSTTREVVSADLTRLMTLDDIKRGSYTFTDGAGLCSQPLAIAAAKVLGLKGNSVKARPSAVQVRIGGAKGILVVSDRLVDSRYQLRESMIKFSTSRTEFCAIRTAAFRRATLNRQYVALFSAHGIPDHTLVNMFANEIKQVRGLPLRFRNNTYDRVTDVKLVKSMTACPIKALAEAGFGRDPCVQEALRVLEVRLLYDLKWRNRLSIQQGVYLMGVPDEFGVLAEGQVFCQWQDPDDLASKPQVVQGDVMICRAPAMHMGDIRRVQAVDHARLRHLVNVIVFNVRGARDLPNMLGGGDLDGDDYTLIWDPRFLIRQNSSPMDYTAPEPIRVPRVTMADVCENFVNYLKNDMLGQIANAHLAWTDILNPDSRPCIELALLHSVAVDFAKTGVPAELPLALRPREWPDFMGKPEKSYVSNKILGKLFRIVDPEPLFREAKQADIERGIDVILGQVRVPTELLVIVAKVKAVYDMEVWALLLRYRLAEAEALCGVILRNASRYKVKDHDLKDPVTDAFRAIVAETKYELLWRYAESFDPEETFHSPDLNCRLSAKHLIAIACYQVAYMGDYQNVIDDVMEDNADDVSDCPTTTEYQSRRRLISFAWLAWEDILSIPAIRARSRQRERE